MARKFKELLEKMPSERQAAIKAGADKLRAEMKTLDELHEAFKLAWPTAVGIGNTLGVRAGNEREPAN